jgi:hypothetical protein
MYRPKHALYERLEPAPPLFANGVLFLLVIILSAGALRDYRTIDDVLAARPPLKRRFRIMEWADGVEDDPVFPEMSEDGPTKKSKNENAWGTQCSDWAKRDGFVLGMGLHAPRKEVIIKADGKGSSLRVLLVSQANELLTDGRSLGQLMKFCGHRNPKTISGHYLDDMSNVDGAAVYLGLEQRQDITQDFRAASMKRNPDLQHSLPAKNLDELKQRRDFVDLCEQIENLSLQVNASIIEKGRKELQTQRRHVYKQRQKLISAELANYRRTQLRLCTTQCEESDQGEWHRSYFDRVVRHMVPERDRLSRTLTLSAPLRSEEGISALRDLIALRTNDSRVAYQEVLQPIEGCCPVPTCSQVIKE